MAVAADTEIVKEGWLQKRGTPRFTRRRFSIGYVFLQASTSRTGDLDGLSCMRTALSRDIRTRDLQDCSRKF